MDQRSIDSPRGKSSEIATLAPASHRAENGPWRLSDLSEVTWSVTLFQNWKRKVLPAGTVLQQTELTCRISQQAHNDIFEGSQPPATSLHPFLPQRPHPHPWALPVPGHGSHCLDRGCLLEPPLALILAQPGRGSAEHRCHPPPSPSFKVREAMAVNRC